MYFVLVIRTSIYIHQVALLAQREREREREREIIFSSCRPIWLATQLRVFEEIINAYIYIW